MNANRVFPRTADNFGLVAVIESKRIVLPLKGVQCDFSIQAGNVEVCLTQIFRQENPKPLDCDYLFPLPADASVYCCEADINGRIIRAQVRERVEAVKLAAQKKAEGSRVVLVESERENLFTLTLNNLQPDDLILIKLKYIQPLRMLADMPSVEIPFCPGIRYIPGNPLIRSNRGRGVVDDTNQVPDASRISPVRVDKEHLDAAFIEIRGTLDAKFVETASLVSPSHNIISRLEGESLTVRLSDKDEVPDRDFVLRWKEIKPETLTSRAWIHKRQNESYAQLEIRAPKAAAGVESPMDFYFLVDRSGSMQGVKWEKAALAVQSSVKTLGDHDRAMVTLFGTHVSDFAEQPLPAIQLLADPNFQMLGRLPLDGGTELGNALNHVLQASTVHSANRQKTLILITDAQVGNDSEILKIMAAATDFPVHCFGIDIALNDALLLALARQQRGTFHSLNPADDVARVVTDLAKTIRHPVLQDLQLSEGWETAATGIPPLYSGQIYYLSARTTSSNDLQLSARNGGREPLQIPITNQPATGDAPYLNWCKQRIQRDVAGQRGLEAVALSIQSNLICPLTAFIAWDESEKVAVAHHGFAQPVFETPLARSAPPARMRLSAGFMAIDAYSPRYRLQNPGLCEDLKPIEKHDPLEIIEQIIKSQSSQQTFAIEPFTLAQLLEAFREALDNILDFGQRLDWKPLCDQIINWVFETESEAMAHSQTVTKLLVELTKRVEELRKIRAEALSQFSQMLPTIQGRTEEIGLIRKVLLGLPVDTAVLASLPNRLKSLGRNRVADQVADGLTKIMQIEKEIHEKLASFVRSKQIEVW
jgi:Ca-activated chloride channel homolog